MKKDELENLLDLMDKYEKADRVSIALNVIQAVQTSLNLENNKSICEWITALCGYDEYKTVYSWIAPHREAKFPFKALIKIAIAIDYPVEALLKQVVNADNNMLKKRHTERKDSAASRVKDYILDNPDASIPTIARELEISEVTVRRHLNNLGMINHYLVKKRTICR